MRKKKLDPEMQQFQADLLQSVRDMKAGHAGRVHETIQTVDIKTDIRFDLFQTEQVNTKSVNSWVKYAN